jgi:hypothetical protein
VGFKGAEPQHAKNVAGGDADAAGAAGINLPPPPRGMDKPARCWCSAALCLLIQTAFSILYEAKKNPPPKEVIACLAISLFSSDTAN